MTKKLQNFVGAPYIFTLKDGKTKIRLGEFTLYSELWAQKEFGTMESFYEKVIGDPTKDLQPDLTSVLKTIIFLMWDEDKKLFGDEIELAKQMTYRDFKDAAVALFSSIRDSLPEELLKKNLAEPNAIRKRMTK